MKKSNGLYTKNTSVNSIKKQCSISVRNKNNVKQLKRNISINPNMLIK